MSGLLGTTTVSDLSGTTSGWTVTAQSGSFVQVDLGGAPVSGGATIAATAVDYDPLTVTKTGTVTATGFPTTTGIFAAETVVTGASAIGNNHASWDPRLKVTLPGNALAGDYKGTVTTSVN